MAIALALMVAAAVAAEQHPDIKDFTKGLMGIFVCWTPQVVLFAVIGAYFGRRQD